MTLLEDENLTLEDVTVEENQQVLIESKKILVMNTKKNVFVLVYSV